MTDQEWHTCSDPIALLDFLWNSGRCSERKRRLFAVACLRRVWSLLSERSRVLVETLERFAEEQPEGLDIERAAEQAVSESDTMAARVAARAVADVIVDSRVSGFQTWSQEARVASAIRWADYPKQCMKAVIRAAALASDERDRDQVMNRERAFQCAALYDIFGGSLRSVKLDPAWLSWEDGAIIRLAAEIYESHAFDQITELAKRLEGAGCRDDAILSHCQGPASHVKGCYVVDLLLGKL